MMATESSTGQALAGRQVLLCVCGGIAAYKAVELVRRLRDAGADVQVAMTDAAQRFVSAQSFQAVSHRLVRTTLWDPAAEAAIRANVATLRARGIQVIGPDDGALAEGESGPGRLREPARIVAELAAPAP